MSVNEIKELKQRIEKRAERFNGEIQRLIQRLDMAIDQYEKETEQLELFEEKNKKGDENG